MSDRMQEHLDIINGAEKDPGKVRGAAVEIKKGFNTLAQTKHRDDLRNLRSSVERRLQEKGLAQGTRDALADLSKTLEEHAIEEPLMPKDLGKQTADKMPVDAVKMPVEKAVDGMNEAVQRTYEEGKRLWNNKEHPVLGKTAVIVGAAAAAYVIYKGVAWLFEKASDAVGWAWDHKWTILTLGAVGYGAYKLGQNNAEAKQIQAAEKDAKKKAEHMKKNPDGSKSLEDLPQNTPLVGAGPISMEIAPNRRQTFQVIQENNETLLVMNGGKYRFMLGTMNLSKLVSSIAVKNSKEIRITGSLYGVSKSEDTNVDQLKSVLLTVKNEQKEVTLQQASGKQFKISIENVNEKKS